VWPYAKTSKALYGSYLYEMNTRYVMWCDSWEEFCRLCGRIGTHEGWRDLPESELPSMHKYLATHSLGDVVLRTVHGFAEVVGNCLISHGYALFFLLFVAFAVALVRSNTALRARVFRLRDPAWRGWFVLPYLAAHLAALSFYGVLGAGERFSLGMFLPATYAMTRAFAFTATPDDRVKIGPLELDWERFHAAVFVLLAIQIATYFPVGMATQYSGG
jgi:hypothetical protein